MNELYTFHDKPAVTMIVTVSNRPNRDVTQRMLIRPSLKQSERDPHSSGNGAYRQLFVEKRNTLEMFLNASTLWHRLIFRLLFRSHDGKERPCTGKVPVHGLLYRYREFF